MKRCPAGKIRKSNKCVNKKYPITQINYAIELLEYAGAVEDSGRLYYDDDLYVLKRKKQGRTDMTGEEVVKLAKRVDSEGMRHEKKIHPDWI